MGDESFNGTVSNSIEAFSWGDLYTVSSAAGTAWGFTDETRANRVHEELTRLVDDVASLAGKINEIIRVLRTANIIGQSGRTGDTLGA